MLVLRERPVKAHEVLIDLSASEPKTRDSFIVTAYVVGSKAWVMAPERTVTGKILRDEMKQREVVLFLRDEFDVNEVSFPTEFETLTEGG